MRNINSIEDVYQNLANEIVLLAVNDYKNKLKLLKRKPDRDVLIKESLEEKFFYSDWFTQLTNMDGKPIAERLKREVWDK